MLGRLKVQGNLGGSYFLWFIEFHENVNDLVPSAHTVMTGTGQSLGSCTLIATLLCCTLPNFCGELMLTQVH